MATKQELDDLLQQVEQKLYELQIKAANIATEALNKDFNLLNADLDQARYEITVLKENSAFLLEQRREYKVRLEDILIEVKTLMIT